MLIYYWLAKIHQQDRLEEAMNRRMLREALHHEAGGQVWHRASVQAGRILIRLGRMLESRHADILDCSGSCS